MKERALERRNSGVSHIGKRMGDRHWPVKTSDWGADLPFSITKEKDKSQGEVGTVYRRTAGPEGA